MMKFICVFALVGLSVCALVDPILTTQCEKWILSNQKDLVLLNLVASDSNINSCQQYCVIAGSGFRTDTTTCRSLCELSGYNTFKSAIALESGLALPSKICDTMFHEQKQIKEEEELATATTTTTTTSFLEVSSTGSSQRKLGMRGDLTVQGSVIASVISSPVGDVKASGELNVLNQIQSSTARASTLIALNGISIKQGIISKKDQLLIKGKIDADSFSSVSLHTSSFLEINNVRQWGLHSLEDFEEIEGADGWSHGEITKCGSHRILGGHCIEMINNNNSTKGKGKGEVSKTFKNLPPHSQIRINAKYMFIDSWDGESGYLKLDDNIVWSESYNHADGDSNHGFNICGNETPERKFGRSIDVTIPHNKDSITLLFGATTDEHPCDESFGIDSVMLFVR